MMKKKVERSGGASTWESLHRDILAQIFNKLNLIDITNGASRVCRSWFLASHNKTLWKTIDLTMIQPIVIHKHLVNIDYVSCLLCRQRVMNFLTELTKLSRMEPKSLSFRLNCYSQEEDLMFVAEKMPNIEKLVLVLSYYKPEKASLFAFSLWKNLKTLIVFPEAYLCHSRGLEFIRTMGEVCTNLINFKYVGYLWDYIIEDIVHYLPSLKSVSLQGSHLSFRGGILLITGLQNLKILNLSHCRDLYADWYSKPRFRDYFALAALPMPEKVITCSQNCWICGLCIQPLMVDWRKDEIKEFEF